MSKQPNQKSIVFYIGSLCRGGAERVIVNLAAYFCEQRYRVTIVTKEQDTDEYPVPEGVTRILADIIGDEISSSRITNLCRRIRKLRNIFKQLEPDYIVSFIKKNNFMAITAAAGMHIPVIVSVRSNPAREYSDKLTRFLANTLFAKAAGVVLQTSQAKEFFVEAVRKKVVILPNSLSEQFLQERVACERRKEIIWVGRMDANKNPKMLLQAFAEIAEKYPEWIVKFVGEGYQREELEKISLENNMAGQISFIGRVDDVPSVIKEASVFVLTSKQEGMPNALIEAMVSGLASISTDCPCGGPAELIQNGINGMLIPVDDRTALVKALDKVLADDEYRCSLGQNAGKLIEKVHPDIVNRKWLEYIESTSKA